VICNSGTAFRARVDGRRLSFAELGIYNGVFVMRDDQTGSLWSHYTGEAFEGPLKGQVLPWIQLERTTFERLKSEHANATMPERSSMRMRSTPPMSGREAMGNQLPSDFIGTLPDEMGSLPYHTHGLGVAVADAHRFYALDRLSDHAVINDTIGRLPVVVFLHDGSATAAAYSSCLDGRTLTFEATLWEGHPAVRDRETGTVWSPQGQAVSGTLVGQALTPIRAIVTDWYGWKAYFNQTDVFEPKRSRK